MARQQIFHGIGCPGFLSQEAVRKFLFVEPFEVSLEGDAQNIEARKQVKGRTVISGSALVSEIYTLKMSIEAASWMAMQLAFGQRATTELNWELPAVRSGKVSAAGEILDADVVNITVAPTFTSIGKVWVFDPANEIALTPVASAPTVNEFVIDTAANKLVFNTARAGQELVYRIVTRLPSAEVIGATSAPTRLDTMSFDAIGYGSGSTQHSALYIPQMSRITTPSLKMSGDVSVLEVEYKLEVVGSSNLPFTLTKLH